MASLDFSAEKPSADGTGFAGDLSALVDQSSMGTRTSEGLYEVKDWDFGALREPAPEEQKQASMGALGSLFARLTGSKVLTEADLKPVLEGMKQHLMKKNVAKEISEKVCEGVGESLVGKKVGGFQSEFSAPNIAATVPLRLYSCFLTVLISQPRTRPCARPCL